ncbi:retroviral integration site protein Fli-1 homolog [Macrobrachium nipponense]|uniref:retroviral integration site protein Fli-1 homolog n=1 Tax=Macrobrachium nipponense TaxID=159736 RepID=UPI0030C897CB
MAYYGFGEDQNIPADDILEESLNALDIGEHLEILDDMSEGEFESICGATGTTEDILGAPYYDIGNYSGYPGPSSHHPVFPDYEARGQLRYDDSAQANRMLPSDASGKVSRSPLPGWYGRGKEMLLSPGWPSHGEDSREPESQLHSNDSGSTALESELEQRASRCFRPRREASALSTGGAGAAGNDDGNSSSLAPGGGPLGGDLLTKIETRRGNRARWPKTWEFLVRLVISSETNPSLVCWEDEANYTFRINNPSEVARRWGARSGKQVSYDHFARGLRYHYGKGGLREVREHKLVYGFGPKAIDYLTKMKTLAGMDNS